MVLTRAKLDEKPEETKKSEIIFELCNQAVTRILGFTPKVNKLLPGSILKKSGVKMLNKPIFLELSTDEKDDLDRGCLSPATINKHVRFKDRETERST